MKRACWFPDSLSGLGVAYLDVYNSRLGLRARFRALSVQTKLLFLVGGYFR